LSKGKFHKLGKHVLKDNNVLVLDFDKYGILTNKIFLNKEDINKIQFTKKTTKNNLSKKSFVQSFLESVRQKMYSGRKR
jgi:outer membrane protein assembly factor BamE (lipoprotein component of BamABCDE complex)